MLDAARIYRSSRLTADLVQRNRQGLVIHVVTWMILMYLSGLARADARLAYSMLVAWIALSLLRGLHYRASEWLQARRPALNYAIVATGLWSAGALWSFALVSITGRGDLAELHPAIVVICAGVVAGGTNANSPDRQLAIGFVGIVLMPGTVSLLLRGYPDPGMPYLLLVYVAFLVILALRQHGEYWKAIDSERRLEEKSLELERLTEIDFLTGLYNRRFFDNILKREADRAIRSQRPLALLLIDLDHFKQVNDTHGHAAGDACLRHCAKVFQAVARRTTDLVARVGGEEFAVLLPETDAAAALRLAERIRVGVAAEPVPHRERRVPLTTSVGVSARVLAVDEQPETLLAEADTALYEAKRQGRNRVCAAPSREAGGGGPVRDPVAERDRVPEK